MTTRTALVDATEQLIQEEGFAAVTSRTVTSRAGVKPPLLHYYFRSMDDLFVEVFQRGAESDLAALAAAAEDEDPLRAMWALSSNPRSVRFITEFMALANHVDRVRTEIKRYAEKRRAIQADVLTRYLETRNVTPQVPPIVVVSLMENITRGQMLESALGMSLGHRETETFIQTCLNVFEQQRVAPAPAAGPADKPPRRLRSRFTAKGLRDRASRTRS